MTRCNAEIDRILAMTGDNDSGFYVLIKYEDKGTPELIKINSHQTTHLYKQGVPLQLISAKHGLKLEDKDALTAHYIESQLTPTVKYWVKLTNKNDSYMEYLPEDMAHWLNQHLNTPIQYCQRDTTLSNPNQYTITLHKHENNELCLKCQLNLRAKVTGQHPQN